MSDVLEIDGRGPRGLKRRARGILLALALALAAPMAPGLAQAQGDPQESDPALLAEKIEQYKGLLEKNPQEGYIFQQLVKLVGYGQQMDKLIEETRQKVEANPRQIAHRLILGHLLKAAQRYPEAIDAYKAAIDIDKNDATAWLGYGMALQKARRTEESLAAFEKALSLEKNKDRKLEILRDLADLAFSRQDWAGAERYYRQMIGLDDSDFAQGEYASRLKENKRYEESLAEYKKMLSDSGRNVKTRAESLKAIGEVYAAMGRYEEALESWKQVLALVSSDSYLRQEIEQLTIAVYRDRNDLNGLVELYTQQWKSPSYEQAMTIAGLYDEMGREQDAMRFYKVALGKNRGSVDARLKIIHLLDRRGERDEVIKAYIDLIKAEPGQPSYQFDLAKLYWEKNDKKSALSTTDKLSRSFASDATVQSNLADLYYQWDMRDKVLDQFQKLVKLAPRDPSFLTNLGEFHWQEGKRDKALESWRKILTSGLPKSEAHAMLGQIYADHNMIREAIEEVDKAIAADPANDQLYRSLALIHERGRDLTRAVEAWQALLTRTTRQHLKREARSEIIKIYHRQGTLSGKLPALRQAFEREQPDLDAGYFLGEGYIALKDFANAEAVFRKILDRDAEDLEALLALNKIYTETNDHQKSIETLRQMARLNPQRARDYYHRIAELSLKLYEDAQAVEFASMMVDLNPSDANAHARLGQIYAQMQDLPRAADEYRTALELDPMAYGYTLELAEIYLALDKVRDADQLYRQLVRKSRDESVVLRAGRKSIDINDALAELDKLERDLTPLIAANPTRKVFGQLQIELYDRMTRSLIAEADYGSPALRKAAEESLMDISRRAIGPLLAALTENDLSQQTIAIRILGNLRNPNAALPLARMLDNEDQTLRIQAALAAGKLGDPRALEPMKRATRDPNATVREIAVWSLGRMNTKEAAGPLKSLMEEDPLWTIRALAAIGLGRTGGPDAVPVLGKRLSLPTERDAKVEVRVAAAWGLGALGDAKGQTWLVQALKEDRELQVRRMAAWALGNIGSLEALEALLEAYWSSDPEVREVAGKALLRLGPDPAGQRVPYVVWEENVGFFNASTTTLDVPFLLNVLLSEDLLSRGGQGDHAIIEGEKSIAALLERQIERSDSARLVAILSDLDQAPDHISLGALTWNLPEDPARRAQTLEALGRIGARLAAPLRKLLTDDAPLVRAHAAGVLGKIGDQAAVDKLIAALDDEHQDVRRKAALALGSLGDKKALAPLIARLSGDKAWTSRAHAATALGMLRDAAALDALTRALADDYTWVRANAAGGLGMLRDPKAVPALIQNLAGASPPVRVEIVRALALIGGADADRALAPFKDDPDPALRDASNARP